MKSLCFQSRFTFPVFLLLKLVNSTVHFDNQAERVTIEINNESVYDLLPAKMPATQSVGAEVLPKKILCLSHLVAHLFGAMNLLGYYILASNNKSMRHLAPMCPFP